MKDKEWIEKNDPRTARLEQENERLSKLLGLIQSYHAASGKVPKWMSTTNKSKKTGTACLQLSDLHLDEVVDPGQVGGLNAYNREIAEIRLKRWANKAIELGELHKHEWEGCIIFLGGDMVSGSIHDELRETNEDYLPRTMVFWAPKIAAAIKQVVDFYGRAHIAGVVGNHGRLTQKMPAKGRGVNSWDWLLYHMIHSLLSDDKRITWDIAEGSYLFVPIYDRHVFFTHGDEVNGGGGWAGIWTPLGTIHRRGIELGVAHKIRPEYSVIGHWHQTILAHHRGICLNGSLKGWDEYAASKRFPPEPARQNWWVETREYGVTISGPIFAEDRKKEGW